MIAGHSASVALVLLSLASPGRPAGRLGAALAGAETAFVISAQRLPPTKCVRKAFPENALSTRFFATRKYSTGERKKARGRIAGRIRPTGGNLRMKLSQPGAPAEELSGTSNVRDMGIKVLFAAWLCRSRFHYAWHVEEDAYMADWIYLLRATAGSTADVIAETVPGHRSKRFWNVVGRDCHLSTSGPDGCVHRLRVMWPVVRLSRRAACAMNRIFVNESTQGHVEAVGGEFLATSKQFERAELSTFATPGGVYELGGWGRYWDATKLPKFDGVHSYVAWLLNTTRTETPTARAQHGALYHPFKLDRLIGCHWSKRGKSERAYARNSSLAETVDAGGGHQALRSVAHAESRPAVEVA